MELFKLVGVVTFSFAPIFLLVRYWRGWKGKDVFGKAIWRLVTAVLLAFWYGYLPIFGKLDPLVMPDARVMPDASTFYQFLALLILLVSIFIFLAAQQGSYVNRLDKLRRPDQPREDQPREDQPYKPEINAAYFLVSCGFWAFSLVAIALIGLIGVHIVGADSAAYGAYEWLIAVLFIGGWIVLMAGALARFRPKEKPVEQGKASKQGIVTGEGAKTEAPENP